MGVWVAGGVSGGHINPAVSIELVTLRRVFTLTVPSAGHTGSSYVERLPLEKSAWVYPGSIVRRSCRSLTRLRELFPCP